MLIFVTLRSLRCARVFAAIFDIPSDPHALVYLRRISATSAQRHALRRYFALGVGGMSKVFGCPRDSPAAFFFFVRRTIHALRRMLRCSPSCCAPSTADSARSWMFRTVYKLWYARRETGHSFFPSFLKRLAEGNHYRNRHWLLWGHRSSTRPSS